MDAMIDDKALRPKCVPGEKQCDDDEYRNSNFPLFHLCVFFELRILGAPCSISVVEYATLVIGAFR
jgi:hypothetical protein